MFRSPARKAAPCEYASHIFYKGALLAIRKAVSALLSERVCQRVQCRSGTCLRPERSGSARPELGRPRHRGGPTDRAQVSHRLRRRPRPYTTFVTSPRQDPETAVSIPRTRRSLPPRPGAQRDRAVPPSIRSWFSNSAPRLAGPCKRIHVAERIACKSPLIPRRLIHLSGAASAEDSRSARRQARTVSS